MISLFQQLQTQYSKLIFEFKMASTQREDGGLAIDKKQLHDRSATMHLEKILLSSSSTSSNNKIQTQSTHNLNRNQLTSYQHMQSVDNHSASQGASNGGGINNNMLNGGQYTYRGVAFNNTGKNWRKLITPAHDSFKKLQQMQPEYSGHERGTTNTAQQIQNGAISNDNSMNTSSDHYSSVKEFNPATNEILQLRAFNQANTNTTNTGGKSMIEIEEASSSSSEEYKGNQLKSSSLRTNHLFILPTHNKEGNHQKSHNLGSSEFGTSSVQMKSLMKSFSNENFGFYENLHKKYFDKAREDKSGGPSKNKKDENKSEKEDVFALSSKTGTIMGLSQLKQSIDSLKTSSRMIDNQNKSALRASSLKPDTTKSNLEKENQKTMSINFKNSLFKKINTTSVFMDDQSQLQSVNIQKKQYQRKDYFDTSSSSSEEEQALSSEFDKQLVSQDNRKQRDRSQKVVSRGRKGGFIKDQFDDDIIDERFHSMLSRRDLSANHDETQSHLDVKTPRDFMNDLHHKSKLDSNKLLIPRSTKAKHFDISPNSGHHYHQGMVGSILSSEQNQNHKMNSLLLSSHQHDFIHQNQDNTNVIFEQPTREEMGDTGPMQQQSNVDEMRPEDLSHMIDQVMSSSQLSSGGFQSQSTNNDVLKTFQEYCKIARQRNFNNPQQQFQTNQKKNNGLLGSQQNSQYGYGATPALLNMNSDQQSIQRNMNINKSSFCPQSAAPANRQQPLNSAQRPQMQTTNTKKGSEQLQNPMFMPSASRPTHHNHHQQQQQLDQRSDFTFVLSNPTDFNLECQCHNADDQSSFITQKHQRLLQNSIKHQSRSRRELALPEIPASPIYSENHCHNCGYQRRQQQAVPLNKYYPLNESIKEVEHAMEGGSPAKKGAVFEYKMHEEQQNEEEEDERNCNQSVEEEMKFLKMILTVSQEYLTRILQNYQIAQPLKEELLKFTQLLSSLAVNQSNPSNAAFNLLNNALNNNNENLQQNSINANMTMSELQLHNDSQLGGQQPHDHSEVVIGEESKGVIEVKGNVQHNKKEETGKFISSLISEGNTQMRVEQEDTVYSYFEDEGDSQESSSFLERDTRGLRQSKHGMRKTLRKSLLNTKQMLKKEKLINREQQDMLKKMQAEIENLNQRWMMTEEKLKAGENAYQILSRTTTSPHFARNPKLSNFRSQQVLTPIGMISTVGSTQGQSNNQMGTIRDTSPANPHMQSHNVLGTIGGLKLPVTPSSAGNSQLETSSNPLIHLNDRLTRQIEDNLHLFDSLNHELESKQAQLVQGEAVLSEKEREVRRLKTQLRTMDENMRQLIEVTKLTSEATEVSKARHRDEMDKIRRRQQDYQKKINRIQSAVGAATVLSDNSEMTIGQIQHDNDEDKENVNSNKSFLRESAKRGEFDQEDSSALLKYSQDLTANSQLLLLVKSKVL